MKQIKSSATPANQRGVALLEGLISIMLISIALVGLMSLQANMLKSNGEAKDRNEAARLVQQQVSALWASATPANLAGSQSAPSLGSGATLVTVGPTPAGCLPGNCAYQITANWTEDGDPPRPRNIVFIAYR